MSSLELKELLQPSASIPGHLHLILENRGLAEPGVPDSASQLASKLQGCACLSALASAGLIGMCHYTQRLIWVLEVGFR